MLLFLWGAVALAAIWNGDRLPAVPGSSAVSRSSSPASSIVSSTAAPRPGPESSTRLPASTPSAQTPPPFQTADDAYFEDAVFIGDSRTEGLMLYGGLNTATFYVHKGLTVGSIFTKEVVKDGGETISILQALERRRFRKVYVMLGVNELGWTYEKVFIQRYGELVEEIRRLQPEAVIYIQSILPISRSRSEKDSVFNNQRVELYNSLLVDMCREKGIRYLNVAEAVRDEGGALPEEATTDGIHLKPAYCVKWRNYLISHTMG